MTTARLVEVRAFSSSRSRTEPPQTLGRYSSQLSVRMSIFGISMLISGTLI